MIQKHNKGYQDWCKAPRLSFRWKIGQMWVCDCGKIYKVVQKYDFYGSWKDWRAIEKELK
jgi:hypothetical protein